MEASAKRELVPGTLEMLVLKTLSFGALHGYGIAQNIKHLSHDVLQIEEGSLYPALQRMLGKKWVKAEWAMTPTKRRARYYTLTALGRRELEAETEQFNVTMQAISRVLKAKSV